MMSGQEFSLQKVLDDPFSIYAINCFISWIPNAQGSAKQLETMIADVPEKDHQFQHLIIAMESTGLYGVHIANYLSACEKLVPSQDSQRLGRSGLHHSQPNPKHQQSLLSPFCGNSINLLSSIIHIIFFLVFLLMSL